VQEYNILSLNPQKPKRGANEPEKYKILTFKIGDNCLARLRGMPDDLSLDVGAMSTSLLILELYSGLSVRHASDIVVPRE